MKLNMGISIITMLNISRLHILLPCIETD